MYSYELNLNNIGRGRGFATYFRPPYKHTTNSNFDGFSITKLQSENMDVIGIYRSQEGNVINLIKQLESLITEGKTTVVGGDFNICALAYPKNYIIQSLQEKGFMQIVTNSTHIDGGLIDHVYLLQGKTSKFTYVVENLAKYYSDHDGIGLVLREDVKDKLKQDEENMIQE